MDSSTYNVASIEKDCNALGGLFQQIINDMKSSSAVWEDFLGKATKLHAALRATSVATSAFLDAFQKVADLATNAKGATKEIGSSLTRLCIRHKSIEKKLRDFTSAILEVMVLPLQEKKEEWKSRVLQLDKEHAKEQKKARSEIKRASSDTVRLQKKLKKGKSDIQGQLNTALQEITDKYLLLEETEKNAVRQALIEQRSHFCQFLYNFKPVIDGEISMMTEMTHIQEIMDALCLLAGDPHTLPPSSEQVINDLKGSDSQQTYNYQSPPSSPSSLGSRKSSMCSINSLNSNSSGSTQNPSPSHQARYRPTSQNSSHDTGSSGSSTGTDSGGTTPSPSYPLPPSSAISTWANWPDPPYVLKQDLHGDRPHTISTAYERSHSRPAIGTDTFEPPEGHKPGRGHRTAPATPNPYAVPCISVQGSTDGRTPSIPPPPLLGHKPRTKAVPTPTVPETARKSEQRKTTGPPPVYVNTHELSTIPGSGEDSAASGGEDDDNDEIDVNSRSSASPTSPVMSRLESVGCELSSDEVNDDLEEIVATQDDQRLGNIDAESVSRFGILKQHISIKNKDFLELSAAMEHLNSCTAALEESLTEPDGTPVLNNRLSLQCSSGYGTMTNTPTCSEDTLAPDVVKLPDDDLLDTTLIPAVSDLISDEFGKYSTMPRLREREPGETCQLVNTQKRPVSMAGMPVAPPTVRRSLSQAPAKAPPPPIRRNSSVTGAIPVVPPHVPKLPGHDGKHLRSQSDGKLISDVDKPAMSTETSGSQSGDGEYVRFTISDEGDRDSVDDLPLPPPPEELRGNDGDDGHVVSGEKIYNHPTVKRSSSLASKHGDIIQKLNQTLSSHRAGSGLSSQQPIYAVPQTVANTPPTSLPCQPQPVYATPQGDTTPIYASPYAQPAPVANVLPIESPDSADDVTPTGDAPPECFLLQIKRGVCLRSTATRDRSAPRL